MPDFETDADRTYMIDTIRIHEKFMYSIFTQKNKRSSERSVNKKDYDKVSAVIAYIEEHESFILSEAEKITKKSSATVYRHFKMLVGTICVVTEGNINNIIYRLSEIFLC